MPSSKVNHTVEPALPSALAANLEHVSVDVANRDARARTARVRHPERHVARAAGEIEQRERALAFRWVHRCHQRVFPGTVQSARHQVVHQVVAAGNRMKNVIDPALLVLELHVFVAEMGLFAALGHAN